MDYKKIFLIGLPGSGKTTFAKKLGEELGIPAIDLDEEICKEADAHISEIFEKHGEEYFRELERKTLNKIVSTHGEFILSTGGGTPCFLNSMELMNNCGITFYINTSLDVIKERLAKDSTRPLLKEFNVEDLHEKRKDTYSQANHTIETYQQILEVLARN